MQMMYPVCQIASGRTEQKNQKHTPSSAFEEQKNQKHTPSSAFEEQENQKHIHPSSFEQKNQKHTPSSVFKEQNYQKHTTPSAFDEQENQKHISPSAFEEQVSQKHIPPSAFEQQKNQKHAPSSALEEQENQKHTPSSAFKEPENQKHIPPSVFEEENQKYILTSTLAEKVDQKSIPNMNFLKEQDNQTFTLHTVSEEEDKQKHIPPAFSTEQGNKTHIAYLAPSLAEDALKHLPTSSFDQDAQKHIPTSSFEEDAQKHIPVSSFLEQESQKHIPASSSSYEQESQKHVPVSSLEQDAQKHISASPSFEKDAQKHIPTSSSFEQDSQKHIPTPSSFEQDAQKHIPASSSFEHDAQKYVPVSSSLEQDAQKHITASSSFEQDAQKHVPVSSSFEQAQKHIPTHMFREQDYQDYIPTSAYEKHYNQNLIPKTVIHDLDKEKHTTSLILQEQDEQKYVASSIFQEEDSQITVSMIPYYAQDTNETFYNTTSTNIPGFNVSDLKYFTFKPEVTTSERNETLPENSENNSVSEVNGKKVIQMGQAHIEIGTDTSPQQLKLRLHPQNGSSISLNIGRKSLGEPRTRYGYKIKKSGERSENRRDKGMRVKMANKMLNETAEALSQLGSKQHKLILSLSDLQKAQNMKDVLKMAKPLFKLGDRVSWKLKEGVGDAKYIEIGKLFKTTEGSNDVFYVSDKKGNVDMCESRLKETFKSNSIAIAFILILIMVILILFLYALYFVGKKSQNKRGYTKLIPQEEPQDKVALIIDTPIEESEGEERKKRTFKEAVRLVQMIRKKIEKLADEGKGSDEELTTEKEDESRPESLVIESSRPRKSLEPKKLQTENIETAVEKFVEDKPNTEPDKSSSVDSDNDQLKESSPKASPVTRIFDWVKDRSSRISKNYTYDENHISSSRSRKSLEPKKLQAENTETAIEVENKPHKSGSVDKDNDQLKERSSKTPQGIPTIDSVKHRGSRISKNRIADRSHISTSRSRKSHEPKNFQAEENIENVIEEENKPDKSSSVESDNDQLMKRSSKTPQVIHSIDSAKHRDSRTSKNRIADKSRSRKSLEPKKIQPENIETVIEEENKPDKSGSDGSDNEQLKERTSKTSPITRIFDWVKDRGSRTSKNYISNGNEYHRKDHVPEEPIEQHSVLDEGQEILPQSSERLLKRGSTKSRVNDIVIIPPYYTSQSNQALQMADESDSDVETLSKPKTIRKRSRQKARPSVKKSRSSLDLQTLISTVETSDEGTIRAGPEELRTKMISTGEIKEIDSMLLGADWTQFVYCKDPSKVQSDKDVSFLMPEDSLENVLKIDVPTKTKNDSTKSLEKEVGMSIKNAESVIRRGRPIAKNDFIYR
ncbi:uncharacterized protein TNIN_85321 [Trichonephila inaurata madagascariensis]|uniref:Uncharacterized protein n=1 Tax=Trichonephila inaurata madagascariensis TaxID=2747483 RepID=A0A8X6YT05_9ARAC|nr:uncharacterized protein TNIN_85321 [Trichonephila inaurata madagascariensis]